ncbi:MAG: vitamin K epoxide reductase family protein [Gammaproteobacteria bacterium]
MSISNTRQTRDTRAPRDLPVIALAGSGLVLALYLLFAHLNGDIAGCSAGGGCDLVQQSRWSTLLGIPIAAWGAAFYAAIAGLAWSGIRARSDLVFIAAIGGLLVSVYLNVVTWRGLGVMCPYCVASFAIVAALAVRSGSVATPAHRVWLGLLAGLGGLLTVAAMHHAFARDGAGAAGAGPRYAIGLAEHLSQIEARFYGAYWCPHCQQQKAMFGAAADRLPYVECSPHGGPGTPQATDCLTADIRTYPTWRIRGNSYGRILSLKELAALSGFDATTSTQDQ